MREGEREAAEQGYWRLAYLLVGERGKLNFFLSSRWLPPPEVGHWERDIFCFVVIARMAPCLLQKSVVSRENARWGGGYRLLPLRFSNAWGRFWWMEVSARRPIAVIYDVPCFFCWGLRSFFPVFVRVHAFLVLVSESEFWTDINLSPFEKANLESRFEVLWSIYSV